MSSITTCAKRVGSAERSAVRGTQTRQAMWLHSAHAARIGRRASFHSLQMNSAISSMKSPCDTSQPSALTHESQKCHRRRACTSICSLFAASLVTDAPHANFLPNFLEASASLMPNRSSPMTVVMHLRLLRVARSMRICSSRAQTHGDSLLSAGAVAAAAGHLPRGGSGSAVRTRRTALACFLATFLPPLFFLGASPSAGSALSPAAA
jgi:hypothetical protein